MKISIYAIKDTINGALVYVGKTKLANGKFHSQTKHISYNATRRCGTDSKGNIHELL